MREEPRRLFILINWKFFFKYRNKPGTREAEFNRNEFESLTRMHLHSFHLPFQYRFAFRSSRYACPFSFNLTKCTMQAAAIQSSGGKIFDRTQRRRLTWFPKTPMLHALLTWSGPNQTAARRAGTDRMNVWLRATNDWPRKVIQNRSGLTLNTFIQDPNVVPIAPAKAANLSPWSEEINQDYKEINTKNYTLDKRKISWDLFKKKFGTIFSFCFSNLIRVNCDACRRLFRWSVVNCCLWKS